MKNIIVGLGELLWDVFPDKKVLGGAPANFAYHIAELGHNGYAVSAIGNDLLGKEILSILNEKKLNYVLETTEYPTGTVQVKLSEGGIPEYEIYENVAWDNIPFTPKTEDLAKNTIAVSFGSLAQRNSVSREMIRKFLLAMPKDSLKIFDINIRQHFYTREVIHESLQLSNAMKINDEEIHVVSKLFDLNMSNEEDVCQWLLEKYGLDILILTRGIDGSFVFTKDETSFQPTPKVEVVDTVGAGDSFTAGFVASYLNGKSIVEAHKLAVKISAYVCTQQGGMPKLNL